MIVVAHIKKVNSHDKINLFVFYVVYILQRSIGS
jgi:hypothetical protein